MSYDDLEPTTHKFAKSLPAHPTFDMLCVLSCIARRMVLHDHQNNINNYDNN